ncbi:MAG TPA: glutamate--tRNA ligase [Dehalococcoidia bacterium]|nr:glutamate--tRNA ligase [Dehalococcoidia bacterium]
MTNSVRVRYAPSPTGYPHVGNIRTALFNWLFARHHNGSFIVRIEDTDVTRKVEDALEAILDGLRWLGLDWDEGPEVGGKYGPYFQSQRLELYRQTVERLVSQGDAYYCYCSPQRLKEMRAEQVRHKQPLGYDRHCRHLSEEERSAKEKEGVTPVVRFQTPLTGQTGFNDLIRGQVVFDNNTLDDFILLKSDGYPTYHLASVVDDHLMDISHVLRAEEWLSSTPRHLLLYQALEFEPPQFAHLPMILGTDRAKLSKRHGASSITEYRGQGYLPESMVNFMALLGWSLDDRTEILSRQELIDNFSLERVSQTAAIFNHEKLYWMNGVSLRELSHEELLRKIMPFLESELPEEVKRPISKEYVSRIVPLIRERINTLAEAATYADFFFLDELEYDASSLMGKKMSAETTLKALKAAQEKLSLLESFDHDSLEGTLRSLAEELGLNAGQLFSPLRVATTGRTAAPPLFETMVVLGKERCLERIMVAMEKLGNN